MELTINGEPRQVADLNDGASVSALLESLGITDKAVAVLQNGTVVAKARFPETPVRSGDTLEIVRFVGGG